MSTTGSGVRAMITVFSKRAMRHALLIFILAFTFSINANAQSCTSGITPCFQGLGFLNATAPGAFSTASGVNADGSVIVGSASYNSASTEGVRWINGAISGIGQLPGCTSSCSTGANGVSADGSVIVGSGVSNGNIREGFRWTNGGMTPLGFLSQNYLYSEALAVNLDGAVIVGDSSGQAVKWIGGTMTALQCQTNCQSQANAVNADGSVIVGVCCSPGGDGQFAAEWLNGTYIGLGLPVSQTAPISVSYGSAANAVNSDGSTIAGTDLVYHLGGPTTGKAWTLLNGTSTALGYLPLACSNLQNASCYSVPSGISSDGKILVGTATAAGGQYSAFLWTATTGMQSVQALLALTEST